MPPWIAVQNEGNKLLKVKLSYHMRKARVKTVPNGLIIDTGIFCVMQSNKPKGGKRGKVNAFSRASRQRLQQALLIYDAPQGWRRYGLCLTVPTQCDNWQEYWLATVERFRTLLTRGSFHHAAIYRVELQQRGMPHLHLVMFTDAPSWEFGAFEACTKWQEALKGWQVEGLSLDNRFIHGITAKAQEITRETSLRYLFEHTSKGKQAQLGYQGRQWGFFGKKWLSKHWEGVPLEERQIIALCRVMRKWSRKWYDGKNKGRLTRCRMNSATYAVPLVPELKQRLLNWAKVAEGSADRCAPKSGKGSSRPSACTDRLGAHDVDEPSRGAVASKGAHSCSPRRVAKRGAAERPLRLFPHRASETSDPRSNQKEV